MGGSSSLPEARQLRHPTGRECLVCRSDTSEVKFPTNAPTSVCSHPPQVCVACLEQLVLTAIATGEFISGISCPSVECSQILGYYDVQKCTTSGVFDRYDKLLLQDSLRADQHYILCLNPSCGAGQEHAGGEQSSIVTCHHCGTKQCFRHQVLWHDGQTCEQWEEQQAITNQQEVMTYEWMQVETKPCPGPGCGRRIQKYDGCDHVICRRPGGCGHQFCWQCLAPWSQIIVLDNSRHYDNCRYYSGLPGDNPAPPEIATALDTRLVPQTPFAAPTLNALPATARAARLSTNLDVTLEPLEGMRLGPSRRPIEARTEGVGSQATTTRASGIAHAHNSNQTREIPTPSWAHLLNLLSETEPLQQRTQPPRTRPGVAMYSPEAEAGPGPSTQRQRNNTGPRPVRLEPSGDSGIGHRTYAAPGDSGASHIRLPPNRTGIIFAAPVTHGIPRSPAPTQTSTTYVPPHRRRGSADPRQAPGHNSRNRASSGLPQGVYLPPHLRERPAHASPRSSEDSSWRVVQESTAVYRPPHTRVVP